MLAIQTNPHNRHIETELIALLFPKIITRYVISELFKVFAVSLIGFVSLMILVGVAQEALRKGLDPGSIVRLVPYILPEALMFAMPATILFSACCVFGRMAAENELVAIKSIGIPSNVAIKPVLVVTFLLSLVGVWLNEVAFTWSYYGVEKVVLDSVEPVVYNMLRTQRNFTSDDISITVQDIDGDRLIEPQITIYRPNGQTVNLAAREGMIKGDPSDHSLVVSLTCGSVQIDNQAKLTFTDTIEQKIPLIDPEEAERLSRNPAHLAMGRIPDEIRQQQSELQYLRKAGAVRAAGQLATGNFLALNNVQWQANQEEIDLGRQRLSRLRVVPWRRWANGFSCLCFVMIGIPIAIRMKSADYATTFGVCFLPVLLFYYPLFMVGMDAAKSGRFPPFCMWLSNVVCIAVGWLALRKEFKE